MTINISDKLIYLGAGCSIGLVLGALFAPHSGQETRHNLSSKVDDLTHKVQEKIHSSSIGDTANQTLHNVIERGKNVARMGRQRFNESVEAGRHRFSESIEHEDLSEQ
jgi:gas vesicle protein